MTNFKDIIENLLETIKTYDYFVDWEKIEKNIEEIEISLNILNYLVGKDNFEYEFKKIIKKYPEVISVIPILIAVRDKEISILNENIQIKKINFNLKNKNKLNDDEIEQYYKFVKYTGIENLIKNKIKNLVDYVLGVEVGMDTNARKNRTGKIMENIIEKYIKEICFKNGNLKYIVQGSKKDIKTNFRKMCQ